MSDFNSSLPVRTENNGDVAAKIVDGITPSQALAVDAAGKIIAKIDDAAGNGLTSQANGSQQALDVGIDVAGVQIDPRSIRALTSADVVTANQGAPNTTANAWPVKPTDGTNSQSFTAAGEAKVDITVALPAGSNAIGSVTVSNFPATEAVTQSGAWTVAATESGTWTVGLSEDQNWGEVGANTLRAAAEIRNATEAADFNNGATGAQTLRVAANLAVGGAAVTSLNPVPVILSN